MALGTDQAINTPSVVLTGASSQIGIFAIPKLVDAGFRVFAVNRKGRPEAMPTLEKVEWISENETLEAAKGCQYLLSAGPLELAQKILKVQGQIKRVVVFSSSSVESKQESGNPAERSQIRFLLKLESELRSECDSRGLSLTVFRPTLIYGCGLDTNISRLASWISRFGFMPVNGAAAGLRQPVHADDLATVALAAMLFEGSLPQVLNLSGGETLSYSDMVSRLFIALDKPVRLLRLPQWLFVLLVNVTSFLKSVGGVNSEMVKRQKLDLEFDDREARQLLGYSPRPFAPKTRDFLWPDFESRPPEGCDT